MFVGNGSEDFLEVIFYSTTDLPRVSIRNAP
jgi:hypothetical protein